MVTHVVGGFMFGFLGSLHCAGMCGPIALALPVGDGGRLRFVLGRVLYNLGRVCTYALLGVLAGVVARYLAVAGVQQIVSIVLGCFVILAVLFPSLQRHGVGQFPLVDRLTSMVSRAVAERMRVSSGAALFVLGLLNGLLPCGFVYLAMAAAATTGETLGAVMFMAGFGAGTIPIMLTASLVGKTIRVELRKRLTAALPVLGVALGVLFILRGLNLGIPYVSPHVKTEGTGANVRCHGETP